MTINTDKPKPALGPADLRELWDSFGDLHVEIDKRAKEVRAYQVYNNLTEAEKHFLVNLSTRLDEMNATLNLANVAIKDHPVGS